MLLYHKNLNKKIVSFSVFYGLISLPTDRGAIICDLPTPYRLKIIIKKKKKEIKKIYT